MQVEFEDREVCTCRESTCIFSEKAGYWEREHFTSHYRITHPLRRGRKKIRHERGMSEGGACRTSLSLFLPMPDSWKACSMSRLRPFLQAVCQKGRGSLEWEREVTLEREHLSQGNKRKATAKRRNRDGEPRWWTMFSICTHLHEKRQRSGHQFH